MVKGTTSSGKKSRGKTHIRCRRCGGHSYHIRKHRCSSCGFGEGTKIRVYSWTRYKNQSV